MMRRSHCLLRSLFPLTALFLFFITPDASAQSGLVAAYGFNEGSGTTTADATGNGNTATLNGAAWNAAGRFGGALSFNGTSNWVAVPDAALLDLSGAMTIEAWVNAAALGSWRTVVMKESATGLCYSLYASDASSVPSGWIRRTSDVDATGASPIPVNTWAHLAATYNGTTLTLYVNGVQAATRSVTGAIATSSSPLRIGGNAIWGEYFSGRIDEVRIYNRALTATEIQTDMVTAVAPGAPPPPPAPDFTLAATPASQAVLAGSAASYTVTVGALNGFGGTVTLAAANLPAGTTASFVPPTVAGAGSTTLTVSTATGTPPGTSALTINGTSGGLTRSAAVALTVNVTGPVAAPTIGIDFVGTGVAMAKSETAGVVPIRNWNSVTGASRTTPLTLVDRNNVATGATAVWSSASTSRLPISDVAGNARMMRGFLNSTATSVTTVSVAGLPAATYDVYVYGDGANGAETRSATYSISGPGITSATVGLTDAANVNFGSTFTQAAGSNGNYVRFTVTGTAFTVSARAATASSGTRRAAVNGVQIVAALPPAPDFSISSQPAAQAVVAPGDASYAMTLNALNGFAGALALTLSGLPANASAVFTPAVADAPGSATLLVSVSAATPSGTFPLTVTGTSGSLVRTLPLSLSVTGPTFSLSGTIAPGAFGGGTAVSLGGAAAASTVADANGLYQFTNLSNGLYQVTPSKNGVSFTPANRQVTVAGADAIGVNFSAAQSPITVSITSPGSGATVTSPFGMTATASAGVVAVQFRVDGANVGAEDTASPFSTSVTAPSGSHTLTAVARDAAGNTVTSAPVTVTVSASSGTALTINGQTTFQTADGFGVNINSLSWKNGELRPALDLLIDDLGVATWRVVFDMEDWEDANDNADPNTPDWTYYNALYANAKFQNLWGTLQHLNSKGVTSGIMLSFMGRVPPWMGGAKIAPAMEDEWVEMIATLLFYARNTANVQFDMVDPLNEPDWDGFEGAQVDQFQYVRLLEKLSARLDAMGLSAMRFVGPNTATIATGVDTYIPQMAASPVVMNKLDHFGLHNYAELTAGADARIKAVAPTKNFWMTELSIPEHIFTMIGQGAASAMIWDAFDSVYNHAILAGAFYNDGRGTTPPNDTGNGPALMSYNSTAGTYAKRLQYRQMQAFKFVARGSVRVAATQSNANLKLFAYRHPATGRVTIVGRNIGSSSITLNGSMSNVGTVRSLQFYQTNVVDLFSTFNRGADVVVTNGSFVVTVPSNSFFTLTSGQ